MFGSPAESDLALCRVAFVQLKDHLGTSRVRIEPVHFADGPTRQWRYDWAESLAREARLHSTAKFELAPIAPGVVPTHFGRNQMSYLWERGAVYSNWLKASPPGADYVWCVEIFARDGHVGAIQVYVFDAKGQVAYCRLFNSHHFGANLSAEGDEAIRLVVKSLFENLLLDPEKLFPPYGIG